MKRSIRKAAVFLLLCLVLTGCGHGAEETAEDTELPVQTVSGAPEETAPRRQIRQRETRKKSSLRLRTGGFYSYAASDRDYREVLRFYEDGTVISVSIAMEEGAGGWPNGNWFTAEHYTGKDSSRGVYTLEGDRLAFTVESDRGTVDYGGALKWDALELHVHSNINGSESDKTYSFTPFSQLPEYIP